MLNSLHPFTPDQLWHHARSVVSPQALFFGIAAVISNHILGAPPVWKALGFLALSTMCLDLITGTLRAGYRRRRRPCEQPTDECSMREKECVCTFNSRDLGATFIKAIVYGAFFLIATFVDVSVHMVIGGDSGYAISTLALGSISGREILSNLENLKGLCEKASISWPFAKVEQKIEAALDAITGDTESDDKPAPPAHTHGSE